MTDKKDHERSDLEKYIRVDHAGERPTNLSRAACRA